jgi:hypothetical protein
VLAWEGSEDPLQYNDAPDVECHERHRERAVDEGAVDEEVYLVEPVAKYGHADRCRKGGQAQPGELGGHKPVARLGPR